jgi:hypothetical protein
VQFWWYVEAPLCFARPVLHQSSFRVHHQRKINDQ